MHSTLLPPAPATRWGVRASRIGALTALGLDLVCLAIGIALAVSSQQLAVFLLIVAAPGLLSAPFVGWRYGPAAAARQPIETWVPRAIKASVLVGLAVWPVYLVGGVIVLGTPGGPANLLAFFVLALFETTIFTLVATLLVIVPVGAVWLALVRTVRTRA